MPLDLRSPTRITDVSTDHGRCTSCGSPVRILERPLVGEVVACARCRAQLEVVDVEPLVVAPVAKIEEDEEDFERIP